MSNRLRALALVLDELGLEPTIGSVDERLTLQKAIYLVQRYAVPLGYSYGWYLKGPYSPQLTRDYYELAADPEPYQDGALKGSVSTALRRVNQLIASKPNGIAQHHWLELLASLDYLVTQSKFTHAAARQKIVETKAHLETFVDAGLTALAL